MPFSGMYDEIRNQDDYYKERTVGDFIEVDGFYSYKGHTYRVIMYDPGLFQMKHAGSGNWYDAVLYASAENGHAEGMKFVREREDFADKFERVHD